MYGTQTTWKNCGTMLTFENDVKMYGTQTMKKFAKWGFRFENDVKMYGTQTHFPLPIS